MKKFAMIVMVLVSVLNVGAGVTVYSHFPGDIMLAGEEYELGYIYAPTRNNSVDVTSVTFSLENRISVRHVHYIKLEQGDEVYLQRSRDGYFRFENMSMKSGSWIKVSIKLRPRVSRAVYDIPISLRISDKDVIVGEDSWPTSKEEADVYYMLRDCYVRNSVLDMNILYPWYFYPGGYTNLSRIQMSAKGGPVYLRSFSVDLLSLSCWVNQVRVYKESNEGKSTLVWSGELSSLSPAKGGGWEAKLFVELLGQEILKEGETVTYSVYAVVSDWDFENSTSAIAIRQIDDRQEPAYTGRYDDVRGSHVLSDRSSHWNWTNKMIRWNYGYIFLYEPGQNGGGKG